MGEVSTQYVTNQKQAVLVVGAGIAGMQAALEIADSEHKVYLVERLPTVGGRMMQLDKTFPTMDCASCIGTPKMSQVGSNRYIELLTYAEVTKLTGYAGNFQATIRKKARSVDIAKCTGCGACAEACPHIVPSEWNMGLSTRKAIFTPFPQAVPNVPAIDRSVCRIFTKHPEKCGAACVRACAAKAISHKQQDEEITVNVGAVIVTTGYDLLDPTPMTQFGYGKYTNVYTSLEFERMVSSTGPTQGHVQLKDGTTPKSAAILHCIGSRDRNYHEYCSRVCCMYGLKHAHLIHEKTGANVYQMYIDMRCFGKGYEEFYKRISDEGVNFVRGKVAQVTDITRTDEEKGKLVVVCEDTLLGEMIRVPVDMVILSVAIKPRADAKDVAAIFGLTQDKDGFFQENHYKLNTMGTLTDGIFLAGCNQGPKDIPDTVSQSIGAAAKAIALVSQMEKKQRRAGAEVKTG